MILAIDIGIRNLALCCLSAEEKTDISSYKIDYWETVNTLESDEHYCSGKLKNGTVCGKLCKYVYETEFSCKSHFPKDIKVESKHLIKKKKIKDYLLQDVAKIVLSKLQNIYDTNIQVFSQVTQILLELQPALNPSMKLISHIIYGKLVELYFDKPTTIRFVRASQKLKAYTGPELVCSLKGAYAKRKWLSIEYCKWILQNKCSCEQKEKWYPFFLNSTKLDDLSDVFLYCINAMYGNKKK